MKVLSIRQPFASLIAEGFKEYEFRSWKTLYRGDILIHAGKGVDKIYLDKFSHYGLDCPMGCIIAKATITDCIKVDDAFKAELRKLGSLVYSGVTEDPQWSGYAFKLENIEKIEPIAINGKLGLWEYDWEGSK